MISLFDWIEQLPAWALYLIILVLTAGIYQTTFALKLPILKNVVVYLVLALGCYLFMIMQIMGFPMIQALLITILLIIVTRIRLWYSKRKKE